MSEPAVGTLEQDAPRPESRERGRRAGLSVLRVDRLAVSGIAGIAFLNGVFEIFRLLLVRLPEHSGFSEALPYGVPYWSYSLDLVFGFALVYLSFNLLKRKRVAWWLAFLGSALALAVGAFKEQVLAEGFFEKALLPPLVLIVLLSLFRRFFTVRSEPRSVWRGVALLALSVAAALGYGTLGFWLAEPKDFGANFSAAEALAQTLREYTFIASPGTAGRTPQANWFLDSLNIAGALALAFGSYNLFRPLAYKFSTLPHERSEARKVLKSHGASSLDFFKLYPEKSYFFSGDGRSFIAYKTAANVAVVLGDPSGPAEDLEDLTRRFLRYCRENGWSVVFHQTLPDLLPMYRGLGMRAIKIGEEALVDLERFALKTAKKKKLRYARRRYGEREGYTARCYEPPHPDRLLEEAKEVSDEWLTLPGRRERGFNLGRFDHDYLNAGRLFVVRDAEGKAQAFANEIPSFQKGEATIDLMRHRPDVPNGVMDFMLVELMLSLFEEGYEGFDLGFAPLAGVGENAGSPLEERALVRISERLGRFFSCKGLREYKAKFDPVWEDRYLVYRGGPRTLAAAGVALARLTEG